MKAFFVKIYKYFEHHVAMFYAALVVSVVALALLASQVRIDENLTSFFPKGGDADTEFVMQNLEAMDKVAVVVGMPDSLEADPYALIDVAEAYADSLQHAMGKAVSISLYYDDTVEEDMIAEVASRWPLLLTEADMAQLDSLTTDEAIAARMKQNKELMMSPLSTGLKHILAFDPLGLSTPVLSRLRSLASTQRLTMVDGYMMDPEQRNLLMFVELPDGFAQTGDNASVVESIRGAAQCFARESHLDFYVYGAPAVAVSNSERVKKDEYLTMGIAMVLIVTVLMLVFRRKRTIVLVIAPVVFGGLFALAGVALMGKELSMMAIGAGAAVLGVALSYSIHMLTHSLHTRSVDELIEDMAYPMTIGSITTIGAFAGLIFTDSKILSDLGLFASLALVGTLIFSLIFLPHFIGVDGAATRSRSMQLIERIAGYDYSRNKWLVGSLLLLTVVCLFCFDKVRFDGDMTKLNYRGDEWLVKSEERLASVTGYDGNRSTLTIVADDVEGAVARAQKLATRCNSLLSEGLISYSSIVPTLLTDNSSKQRSTRLWKEYWTEAKRQQVVSALRVEAQKNGFAADAFGAFEQKLYDVSICLPDADEVQESPVFSSWFTKVGDRLMLNFNVELETDKADYILGELAKENGVVVTDMGYHVRRATTAIVTDFNTILLVSSALVALVLLLSYGRIELFAMTFLPMCISWVIILGLMALFGVEFNVVNIILSTFIFGVGDDFSIFIMDGLQSEYRNQKQILTSHKTAIALSAFAVVGGLAAHAFAQHPAVRSIGLLSIFGLVAVIFTSYIVQPVLFRVLVSNPSRKGAPWTLSALVRTIAYYGYFASAYFVCIVLLGMLFLVPIGKWRRKLIVRRFICAFMRSAHWLLGHYYTLRRRDLLDLSEPRIIIANHQSHVDISLFLAAAPKVVFVTKMWVNRLPLIGPLVNYCGFCSTGEGTEQMEQSLREYVEHGYSVVIFPEGTRSEDGEIHRFHKGAFKLAEDFGLKILPVLFYGNGNMLSKAQPMRFRRTQMFAVSLPLIDITDPKWGPTMRDKVHAVQNLMRAEYDKCRSELIDGSDPYITEVVVDHLIYRDPLAAQLAKLTLKYNSDYRRLSTRIADDATVVILNLRRSAQSSLMACYLAVASKRRKVIYCNEYDDAEEDICLSTLMDRLDNVERRDWKKNNIGEHLQGDDYLIISLDIDKCEGLTYQLLDDYMYSLEREFASIVYGNNLYEFSFVDRLRAKYLSKRLGARL